LLFQLYW